MYTEFDNIIARLKQGRTWDFPGGVHPPQQKQLSNDKQIDKLPLPAALYVPVKQHIGVEGHLIVETGDQVLKGQKLTKSMNPFAVPVHAPTSGTIGKITKRVSAHPSGLPDLNVEILPDGLDSWGELSPLPDYQQHPKFKIIETICAAGISGMGGAGFPTHIKAAPKKDVEFLIINGVECEPYITSDDRLMREHAWQIRQGIDVLSHLLSPKQVIIAIEDNKPEAIEAMQVACQENDFYLVCAVPTKYPAGGEKQLIQMLTNREVPQQGLPIDVGVIMQNVGTCFAVADAIFAGKPLIQRVVTLTGEAINQPGNFWTLIGTPMSHLLASGDYQSKKQKRKKIIMGGPMMGFDVASDDVPVVKITNCVLVPSDQEMPASGAEQACIRCSACADACPASLLPQQLFWHSKAKELDKAQEYNLFDCIECGACAYVCPSEIPLVHYYRIAKSEIRNQEQEKDKAEKAKERFEARKQRLVKEQEEREEKHRKAAEARRQKMATDGDAKDKIAAALARAKAKKAEQPAAESDTKQDKVAAAIARAKAKKAAAPAADAPVTQDTPPESKEDKVAAAIARAKAKRAAAAKEALNSEQGDDAAEKPVPETNTSTADESKQAKVAAAVARAKAKKAAQAQVAPSADEQSDAKEDKVAAAIAKAKAKRAAAQQKVDDTAQEQAVSEPSAKSDKQDKVSAAIARAKAKRAEKLRQQDNQEDS